MTLTDIRSAVPDLDDPATFAEGVPYEFFAQLRETEGLYWQEASEQSYPDKRGYWVATRRADILAIENDPETFTSTSGIVPRMVHPAGVANDSGTILFVDPPDHSRLRRVVSKSLAPRVVAHFETWIRDIVTVTLDEAVPLKEFDFVSQVAAKIPSRTIAKVVGLPDEMQDIIVKWTNNVFDAAVRGDLARVEQIAMEMDTVTNDLRVAKLANPADDLISYLAPFERDGEISRWDFEHLARNFINAGFETTHTTISQTIRMIAEKPDVARQFEQVMAGGDPAPFTDEAIRIISPVMVFMREATRDTEIAGTKIRKGDVVSQWYGAANRDPNIFENPDEFITDRPNAGEHLAFGAGVHRCIGAPLARLQIRILLEEVHRRGLKFEIAGEPRRGYSNFINALTYLPLKVIAGA